MIIDDLFEKQITVNGNFITIKKDSEHINQQHTNDAFSEKWSQYEKSDDKDKLYEMQKEWYLKLYGFKSENDLADFLSKRKIIFDAGCGLGYKSKWFADLSPDSIVIGMDFSDAAQIAAENYKDTKNLFFIQGDIAKTTFHDNVVDYVNCDQVIMHTEDPETTFAELSRITKHNGHFACYVYAKKALPRELLDDHFRSESKNITHEELWEMSRQLTELGKVLSELNITVDIPEIPLLGIKGGRQDVQRFIYWNFLKCFWNEELGKDTSDVTNFDWYSPSNAKRYSREEFEELIAKNKLNIEYFHSEEACHSGRFCK